MRTLARLCTAAAPAALALAVLAPPAQGVTGGAPDGGAHPYVVGLLAPGDTVPRCSGVLVRPDNGRPPVVLTDGHCLVGSGRSGTARVYVTPSFSSTTPLLRGRYTVDALYGGSTAPGHDLAVIVLDAPPAIAPAVLAPVGSLDRSPLRSVTTVGVGRPFLGQRRSATERVYSRDALWLFLLAGTGNSCGGDSGGPDLRPGTSTVVALTDQGSCANSQDTRTDTRHVHDLVDYVASPLPALTARLSATQVRSGSAVTLRGTVHRAYAGRAVYRQGWYGGAWHTWASTTVGSTGSYAFAIRPTVRTVDLYRVYLPARPTSHGGTSPTQRLTVS